MRGGSVLKEMVEEVPDDGFGRNQVEEVVQVVDEQPGGTFGVVVGVTHHRVTKHQDRPRPHDLQVRMKGSRGGGGGERDVGGGDGGGRRGGFDDRGGRTESMNTHNVITSTTIDMLMASDEAQGVDDPLEAARLTHSHHVDEEMGDLMRQEGGDGGGGRGGVEVVEGRVEEGEMQLFDGDAEDLQDLSGQRMFRAGQRELKRRGVRRLRRVRRGVRIYGRESLLFLLVVVSRRS